MDNYQLIYSKRKTLSIQVKANGNLIVRAPIGYPKTAIDRFVLSRIDWIKQAQKRALERTVFPEDPAEIAKLKELARKVIPLKVEKFSKIMGLSPTNVRIGSARGRFGSCSSVGALNFSCFLMLYPEEAIDYVVVHELAHLVHMNHSKSFYGVIEKYMPDYKERKKLLKNNLKYSDAE